MTKILFKRLSKYFTLKKQEQPRYQQVTVTPKGAELPALSFILRKAKQGWVLTSNTLLSIDPPKSKRLLQPTVVLLEDKAKVLQVVKEVKRYFSERIR